MNYNFVNVQTFGTIKNTMLFFFGFNSHLNLCGSSVSLEAVKIILTNCPLLTSINLSSCRGLPRGVKRLMQGSVEISELRENLGVTQQEV